MKTRFLYSFIFLLILTAVFSSCQATLEAEQKSSAPIPAQMLEKPYLFEVVRHLYRWQLDETQVQKVVTAPQFIFWVHRIEPKLDSADNSILGEIFLPQVNLSVKVKKADYTIEELATVVKSKSFKIVQITNGFVPAHRPASCQEVRVDMKEMLDYLFRTRNQRDYPDEQLIVRLRQALRKQMTQENLVAKVENIEHIVHLAPLSPVANETWVFWEEGRKLFYFASDIDIDNPAVWQHEEMMVRLCIALRHSPFSHIPTQSPHGHPPCLSIIHWPPVSVAVKTPAPLSATTHQIQLLLHVF